MPWVCAGAMYIFHVASPVKMTADDHQKDIVDPAVEVLVSERHATLTHALPCRFQLVVQAYAVLAILLLGIVPAHSIVLTQL